MRSTSKVQQMQMQQQQLKQLQQQQPQVTQQQQQPAPAQQPRMPVQSAPAPAPKPASRPISTKATTQPKSSEGRLVGPGAAHMAPLVGQRLNDLLHSLDPNYSLDSQAEDEVLRLAQNFLDSVVTKSIRLSQHRGSKTLDVQDVQFVLAKQWGIVVPGLGPPTRPANRAPAAQKRKSETNSGSGGGQGTTKKAKVGA
jgi:hypothetical protein